MKLAILILLAGQWVFGQPHPPTPQRTLRLALHTDPLVGISDVLVFVQPIEGPLHNGGLRQVLQTDTELRLRKAGVRVAAQSASATLNVLVTSNKRNEENPFAVFVIVSLVQPVLTLREPSVLVDADTWHSSTTVALARGNADRNLRHIVSDKVDEFINAYLEANPK